jgi:hypothetical protein
MRVVNMEQIGNALKFVESGKSSASKLFGVETVGRQHRAEMARAKAKTPADIERHATWLDQGAPENLRQLDYTG